MQYNRNYTEKSKHNGKGKYIKWLKTVFNSSFIYKNFYLLDINIAD